MVRIAKEMLNEGFVDLFTDIPKDLFKDRLNDKTHAWLGGRSIDLVEWTFLNHTVANGRNVNYRLLSSGRIL